MDIMEKHKLVANLSKAKLYASEVEFCGHILRDGTISPAPGKLLSIQCWDLPKTITQLRGFLGLANYYSGYVKDYAHHAALLTTLLQLKKEDGKKGSKKPIHWTPPKAKL